MILPPPRAGAGHREADARSRPPRPRLRRALAPLVLTACTLAIGCGREGAREPQAHVDDPGAASAPGRALPDDRAAARDQWLRAAFLPSTTAPGDVIERFGPPDRRRSEPTPNRHVPHQTDSIVTLEYDRGLRTTFYAVTGGDELLQTAEVAAPGILDDSPVD